MAPHTDTGLVRIGAETCQMLVVGPDGEINPDNIKEIPTGGYSKTIEQICRFFKAVKPERIGVAVAGIIRVDKLIIADGFDEEWINAEIAYSLLGEFPETHICVLSAAHAAALGESALREDTPLSYIQWGPSLATATDEGVENREHDIVEYPFEVLCSCGGASHFKALLDLKLVETREGIELSAMGKRHWEECLHNLALLVRNLSNNPNPAGQLVVVDGEVPLHLARQSKWLGKLREFVEALPSNVPPPTIELAKGEFPVFYGLLRTLS